MTSSTGAQSNNSSDSPEPFTTKVNLIQNFWSLQAMAQIVHAARMGDEILHPSLIAEMVSAVAEAVIYAAATAAVAAAISLAVVGTVATGGAAGIAIAAVAGVAVGVAREGREGQGGGGGDRGGDEGRVGHASLEDGRPSAARQVPVAAWSQGGRAGGFHGCARFPHPRPLPEGEGGQVVMVVPPSTTSVWPVR